MHNYRRGYSFYVVRKYDKAIEDFTKALSYNPSYVLALFYRANSYFEKKDLEPAIDDYSIVLQLDSQHEKAFLSRGIALGSLGKYNDCS